MLAYDAATNLFNFRQNGAWVNLGGGTPGGSSGDIQYNNGGTFGGFGDYNSTSDRLTITGTYRSENSYSFTALGGSNSYKSLINWCNATISNGGSLNQAWNIFVDDSFAELEDRSALIEFNILLTKSDGSASVVKKVLVVYLKDGTADAVIQNGPNGEVLFTLGSSTPTVTFGTGGGFPQVTVNDNSSGGWKVKIWADVSISN